MLFLKIGDLKFIRLEKAKDITKLIKKQIVDKNGNIKTVYVKITDELNIKRSVEIDKRKWFLNEKNNDIKELSDFMRNQNIEYCCISNDGQKSFFKKVGHKSGINFTDEEIDKIYNVKLFVHNHPKGHSFSLEDLSMFLFKNIKEMQIVCYLKNKKTTYSLRKRKKIPVNIIENILNDYFQSFNINEVLGEEKPSNHAMMSIIKQYGEYLIYERYRK